MLPEIAYAPPEPLVIDFDPPIKTEDNGRELSRLSVGEPSAAQVMFAEAHLVAKNGNRATRMYQRTLVAKVAGVPEKALDAVPICDFNRAARFCQDFIESNLPSNDQEAGPQEPTMSIRFDPAISVQSQECHLLTIREPTLGQMAKADSHLGDMSAQRVRSFQEALVSLASGEPATLIAALPISMLNLAATFAMGFSDPARRNSTS